MDADKMHKKTTRAKASSGDELQPHLVANIIELIHHRVGMLVKYNQHDLHKAIHAACERFDFTPQEYLAELKRSDNESPILVDLINAITIGETYFFRDKQQLLS